MDQKGLHALRQALNQEYLWRLSPGWNDEDIDIFHQVASDINQRIQELANVDGSEWMRLRIGPARIHQGSLINRLIKNNFVLPRCDVWLLPGCSRQTIVHELAHILDNRLKIGGVFPATFTGGGPADALFRSLGGKPRGWRFSNGTGDLPVQYLWPISVNNGYGNHSSADYFAEAFTWLVYDVDKLPGDTIRNWMIDFIQWD